MCDSEIRHLSTAGVAAALGVGESSVKRWIDAGKLPAEKTPGGHRRIGLLEFYGFLRATGRKLVDPAAAGLRDLSDRADGKSPLEICQDSLQNGNAFTFESALQIQRISGKTPAAIIDNIVYPAFQAVRATCTYPSEGCMTLHRAILMIQTALRATIPPSETFVKPQSPRIVLADIGEEIDGLPTWLAEAAVWDQAHCLQLGTGVPTQVLEGALESFAADVLWLSMSGPAPKRKILSEWQSIVEKSASLKVKLIAYGDAVPRSPLPSGMGATSFSEFRGFVTALAGAR